MSVEEEIIRLPARFDFSQHRSFAEKIDELVANSNLKSIVVDFSHVQFIDSSALGMLVLLNKKAQSRSISVVISGCRGSVLEIMQMAKMEKIFNFV